MLARERRSGIPAGASLFSAPLQRVRKEPLSNLLHDSHVLQRRRRVNGTQSRRTIG